MTFTFWGIPDDEEGEFLIVHWYDEGEKFEVSFHAKDNFEVEINKESMFLIAENGEKEEIGLVFELANLEEDKQV